MCLSGDPFVPNIGAVTAEESCEFDLEKSPPDLVKKSISEAESQPNLTKA
jgi:hypothetical protein